MDKISSGKHGEKIAALFLQKHGYKIIELNFRTRYGEIDIIANDKDTLVFVEVKTRKSYQFGKPEEAVVPKKIYNIKQTGEYYKSIHPELPNLLRIDVVAIDEVSNKITLFKNITE